MGGKPATYIRHVYIRYMNANLVNLPSYLQRADACGLNLTTSRRSFTFTSPPLPQGSKDIVRLSSRSLVYIEVLAIKIFYFFNLTSIRNICAPFPVFV